MLVLNNRQAFTKLNFLAHQALYKSFSFKKLRGCDVSLRLRNSSKSFTQKLVLQDLFNYNYPNINSWVLTTCKVLEVRSSFLLLGTGQKYTRLQPKFKVALSSRLIGLVSKDLLFGSFGTTIFSFLKFSKLVFILRPFWYTLELALSGRTTSTIWQTLLVCKREAFFFYFTLFSLSLSDLQKRINFVQFNAFLKSAHIPLLHNQYHASVR